MSGRRAGLRGALVALAASVAVGAGAQEPRRGAPAADDEPEWVGRWAMRIDLVTATRIPLLGTERSTTTSVLLVDIRRRDDRLVQVHRVCDAWMESSAPATPRIPPAFVRALPVRGTHPEVRFDRDGWSYTADLGVEAIGYDPRLSPGALPTRATDAAVSDTDGDGAPGATVELKLPIVGRARIFIVQRSRLVLDGRRTGQGRVDGRVRIRVLEQHTLGARPTMFARNLAIRPLADESAFALVRVPTETSCAGLARRESARLFGAGPPLP